MVDVVPKNVRIFCYPNPSPDTILAYAALVMANAVENMTFKKTKVDEKQVPTLYVFVSKATVIDVLLDGCRMKECFELDKSVFDKSLDKLVDARINENTVDRVLKSGAAK